MGFMGSFDDLYRIRNDSKRQRAIGSKIVGLFVRILCRMGWWSRLNSERAIVGYASVLFSKYLSDRIQRFSDHRRRDAGDGFVEFGLSNSAHIDRERLVLTGFGTLSIFCRQRRSKSTGALSRVALLFHLDLDGSASMMRDARENGTNTKPVLSPGGWGSSR